MDHAASFPPFDQLDEARGRRLWGSAESLSYRTGKVLYYQGDRMTRCFLVLEGTVRTVMYRTDETSLDLGTQGPGDWLGLPEILIEGPALCDAVALDSCRVLGFDRSAFDRLRRHEALAAWLPAELARRYYALHARVELAHPGQRLARWLIAHQGPRGALLVTQDEAAAAVGTTRETVNRHLGRMQLEGLVRVERGRVTVLDAEGLKVWGGES